jgi:hypothetical protein
MGTTGKVTIFGAGIDSATVAMISNAWIPGRFTPKRVRPTPQVKPASPLLSGGALLVEKSEAASALIYWNGKRYVWSQQGDQRLCTNPHEVNE